MINSDLVLNRGSSFTYKKHYRKRTSSLPNEMIVLSSSRLCVIYIKGYKKKSVLPSHCSTQIHEYVFIKLGILY